MTDAERGELEKLRERNAELQKLVDELREWWKLTDDVAAGWDYASCCSDGFRQRHPRLCDALDAVTAYRDKTLNQYAKEAELKL